MKTHKIDKLSLKKYQIGLCKFLIFAMLFLVSATGVSAQTAEDYLKSYDPQLSFSKNSEKILKKIQKDYPLESSENELNLFIFANSKDNPKVPEEWLKIAGIGVEKVRLKYKGPLAVIDHAIWGSNPWLRFGAVHILLDDLKSLSAFSRFFDLHPYSQIPLERKNKLVLLFLNHLTQIALNENPTSMPDPKPIVNDLAKITNLLYPHSETRTHEIIDLLRQTSSAYETQILKRLIEKNLNSSKNATEESKKALQISSCRELFIVPLPF